MLLNQFLEAETRNKIEEYARVMGGIKANGEPWTAADTEDVLKNVKRSLAEGKGKNALERSEGGVIIGH